jgi:divalent metal cation (Fe/Co/Zn/Cd) transporter
MSSQRANRFAALDSQAHVHGDSCPHVSTKRARAIVRLQLITVGWMLVECSAALTAAWKAHSAALLAFGSDSAVELFSAVVVLMQFASFARISPERAARVAGVLLLVLASIVGITSITAIGLKARADTSALGMGVTVVALLIMPILSWAKRKNAEITANRALAADAVQSATCAYLAALTLLGLILNAVLHIHWIDPVAALIAIPIIVIEAKRALRGKVCECC